MPGSGGWTTWARRHSRTIPRLVRRAWRWGALPVLLTTAAALGQTAVFAAPRKPAPPPAVVVDHVRLVPLEGNLSVAGGNDYRGTLDVVRSGSGLAVVNTVGFEDYLKGISEVPTSWPAEAQKAQAIAARTYAFSELLRAVPTAARAAGADLCATDACQVYAGLSKERREGSAAWTKAVADTRGQVLLYKGAPIVAKYSSSNGGRSVAGGYPYLRAVDDPDDRHSPLHRWTSQLPLEQVRAALALPGPITRAARSGGVVAVVWSDDGGSEQETVFEAADFRKRLVRAVGAPEGLPQAVPSGRFAAYADPANGVLVLEGAGWGHGLGMSQWGAYGKALRGIKAPDILASYYAGLRPVPAVLPEQIKVAVAIDVPTVVAGSAGRFRILDKSGKPLALSASGGWRLEATPGGIKVTPPADQAAAPSVAEARLDGAIRPGQVSHLRFRLSAPALVTVSLHPPAGPEVVLANKVVEGGDVAQPIPPLGAEGSYVATITVDAGMHRKAATSVPFQVTALRSSRIPAAAAFAAPQPPTGLLAAMVDPTGPPSPLLTLVALVALAAVGSRLNHTLRRLGLARIRPLH